MSYQTWTINGYGICVDDLIEKINSLSDEEKLTRLNSFIEKSPDFAKGFNRWVKESFTDETPPYSDIVDEYQDSFGYYGLGAIINSAMCERYDMDFTLCDDFDGFYYILFEPRYPWSFKNDKERNQTMESLTDIFNEVCRELYGGTVEVGYQEVANGG